jgi:hypothetical protein
VKKIEDKTCGASEDMFEEALKRVVFDRAREMEFFRDFDEKKPSVDLVCRRRVRRIDRHSIGIVASAACIALISLTIIAPNMELNRLSDGLGDIVASESAYVDSGGTTPDDDLYSAQADPDGEDASDSPDSDASAASDGETTREASGSLDSDESATSDGETTREAAQSPDRENEDVEMYKASSAMRVGAHRATILGVAFCVVGLLFAMILFLAARKREGRLRAIYRIVLLRAFFAILAIACVFVGLRALIF